MKGHTPRDGYLLWAPPLLVSGLAFAAFLADRWFR